MSLQDRIAASQPPITVVIADDEPLIRELLAGFLRQRHLRLLYAGTGREALVLIHQELPRLVLLDVDMPESDGIEVCRAIRADPLLASTRVIIVTAQDELAAIQRGRAAGPDAYLTKPFRAPQLLELVDALLGFNAEG